MKEARPVARSPEELGAGVARAEKPAAWFVPAGAVIGFAGALCGIGGGIFAGPLLHVARGVPLRRAAATALLVVLATSLSATVVESVRGDSELAWPVALPLAAGALVGAQLGFALSRRLEERALKRLFALVLALAGVRVLFFTGALSGGLAPGSAATLSISLAIGLLGGALTPLLGVAGGVLMVPALFLTFAELGFGGARACALAAGAVAAVRALWLHARAGNVSASLGLPLAAGALLGAFGGVAAAHDPELAQGGRILLGIVLLAQSVRFLADLRGARGQA